MKRMKETNRGVRT